MMTTAFVHVDRPVSPISSHLVLDADVGQVEHAPVGHRGRLVGGLRQRGIDRQADQRGGTDALALLVTGRHRRVRRYALAVRGVGRLDLGEPTVDLFGHGIVDRRLDDDEPCERRGGHEADDRSDAGEHGAGNGGRLHERHRGRDRREKPPRAARALSRTSVAAPGPTPTAGGSKSPSTRSVGSTRCSRQLVTVLPWFSTMNSKLAR